MSSVPVHVHVPVPVPVHVHVDTHIFACRACRLSCWQDPSRPPVPLTPPTLPCLCHCRRLAHAAASKDMLISSGRSQADIAKIIPQTAGERRAEALRIAANIDSIPSLRSNITSLLARIEVLEVRVVCLEW